MNMQRRRLNSNGFLALAAAWAVGGILLMMSLPAVGQSRIIEVLAGNNSRFKVAGQDRPEITVKAGEPLLLRIEARKGKSWNRNGAVHGFTLLRAKDRAKVPGWDFELQPGESVDGAVAVPAFSLACFNAQQQRFTCLHCDLWPVLAGNLEAAVVAGQ